MQFILQASKLMKARDVREQCEKARQNPATVLVLDFEYRRNFYKHKKNIEPKRALTF